VATSGVDAIVVADFSDEGFALEANAGVTTMATSRTTGTACILIRLT
jgi:hypothetical protein